MVMMPCTAPTLCGSRPRGGANAAATLIQAPQSQTGRSGWLGRFCSGAILALSFLLASPSVWGAEPPVDFNRDIRKILSENCFACHGPAAKPMANGKKALRLDLPEVATDAKGGKAAISPGHPERSEMIRRITTSDADDKMPPSDSGKKLTSAQIATLEKWIRQGAPYARHWSYAPPVRPALPSLKPSMASWVKNPIDPFIVERLAQDKLTPSPEADRETLIRRASLDLTGLPPSVEEVDAFLTDRKPGAYERLVDRLLAKPSFGEHWARLWLDQARYADSSGYADDPPRTIWAFRDYVIRALNENKPFDRFTLEQIAGDLLPDGGDEALVATAFHRNTLTNNEGGTNDEEFRNVAVVDRVNTTLAVWMGTTMACAQCHNHKYDPITQEDYFKVFAILNNTADADRTDESPVLPLLSAEQKQQKKELGAEIARLEAVVKTPTEALSREQVEWEAHLQAPLVWETLAVQSARSQEGAAVQISEDNSVHFAKAGKTDVYTLTLPIREPRKLIALGIEALPEESLPGGPVGHGDGNFVLSRLSATVVPPQGSTTSARYVRVELPGEAKFLSLAEVQVFSGSNNIALRGDARQSSTAFGGNATLAIDGNTDGQYEKAKSTTHTEQSKNPWWELDLKSIQPIDRIAIWNRTDGVGDRLAGFKLILLDAQRKPVWEQTVAAAPTPSAELRPDGSRPIPFSQAVADFSQKDFDASQILNNGDVKNRGWAIAPRHHEAHALTLVAQEPTVLSPGSNLVIRLEQLSQYAHTTLARLRIRTTADPRAAEIARIPADVLTALKLAPEKRTGAQKEAIRSHFLTLAPGLKKERDALASARQQLEGIKPYTTVPVLRELSGDQRRKTFVQKRGNWMDLGAQVSEGLPSAFNQATAPSNRMDRVALARWLVDRSNPLTARVEVNRLWESLFGIGIVRTSEEFGSQGEPPSHPALLDWLAVELMDHGWNVKHILRLMATSATYRQSSKVSPELAASDPENRLLARGPRFRLSAEMVRDQALSVAGLLSPKMYGPPVKPLQPSTGLSAAFGSGIDWETSKGEDQYRRALYTTWRRSNPYPSMATFDAPNREVCTVRRERSNTPLQALVTLNDPVYLEAAQALGQRVMQGGKTTQERLRYGFRLCLARPPSTAELTKVTHLLEAARERFAKEPEKATAFAGKKVNEGTPVADAAAWTVIGNVLLNLDEMLMKR